MNTQMKLMVALVIAAIVGIGILGPWHQRQSEAIGPDINDDGVVDLLFDILGVVQAYGKNIPTPTQPPTWTPLPTYTPNPTYTPFPTSTPTAVPSPETGGGNEQVLAYDVTVQPSSVFTTLATIDADVCKGLVFYLAARSTDGVQSTVFDIQDGPGGFSQGTGFQADPAWKTWLSPVSTGTGLVTFAVRVTALDLFPARFVLEAHCEPSHP